MLADFLFRNLEYFGEIFVGKTVFLGLNQECVGQFPAFMPEDFLLELDKFAHLVNEVRLDVSELV